MWEPAAAATVFLAELLCLPRARGAVGEQWGRPGGPGIPAANPGEVEWGVHSFYTAEVLPMLLGLASVGKKVSCVLKKYLLFLMCP